MGAPSAYSHETFAIATMHAKGRVVARPFSRWLGAAVKVAPGIDTDAFGTFTGDIVRQGTMFDAARAKALAAIEAPGLELGLGSEGSFGPHPFVPFIPGITDRTNYQSCDCMPGRDITDFLTRVRFPSHAVVVSPKAPVEAGKIVKGITRATRLAEAIEEAASASRDGHALVVTDMRAHLNPTRMASIRALAIRLARRLATPCRHAPRPDLERWTSCAGCPAAGAANRPNLSLRNCFVAPNADLKAAELSKIDRKLQIPANANTATLDHSEPGKHAWCNTGRLSDFQFWRTLSICF